MQEKKSADKVLTVQVYEESASPRTFKVPLSWLTRASWLAWLLLSVSIVSSLYAARIYFMERSARPELVKDLENEIQELKIALEKKSQNQLSLNPNLPSTSPTVQAGVPEDKNASDTKPQTQPGEALEGKAGIWNGLAENITAPPASFVSSIKLEDAKVDWQGKYANFSVNVLYREPGKGSQQGHIVALARANDRIYAHPEGVLNTATGAALFDPTHGEYFSVARFRVLKTRLGPFETPRQLSEVQVFLFDLNQKLILNQTFKYGK